MFKKIQICFFLFFLVLSSCDKSKEKKVLEKQKFEKGYRFEKNGWTYVHIEGKPFERGKQYGYLIAKEYVKAIDVYKKITFETTGVDFSFFIKKGAFFHKNKIPNEYIEEMQGMVEGLKLANVESSVDEIIGWNSYLEITSNWWPKEQEKYVSFFAKRKDSKCSAFIATGSATKNKEIVAAHSTFDDFWNAPFDNIILDLVPDKGNRILMQTQPLYLSSMQDFLITSGGIIAVETTLANFNGYDVNKTPEYIRARLAMQYGNNIDEFINLLNKGNNGGVAATWLIGDSKTGEIAQFQQGLLFQKVDKKKDGYFFGFNAADDPRIRNLECSNEEGYNDIRRHTGARRVRWQELLEKYDGKIDINIAKKMLQDHYDVYSKKEMPSAKTICAHYDEDPRHFMSCSSAAYPNPYSPNGSIDGKIVTSNLAKEMKIIARFGRACGKEFNAKEFLKEHRQWEWQRDVLQTRLHQPWTFFYSDMK